MDCHVLATANTWQITFDDLLAPGVKESRAWRRRWTTCRSCRWPSATAATARCARGHPRAHLAVAAVALGQRQLRQVVHRRRHALLSFTPGASRSSNVICHVLAVANTWQSIYD